MKPIFPNTTYDDRPGHCMREVNAAYAITNVVNAHLAANHRAAYRSALTLQDVLVLFDWAAGPLSTVDAKLANLTEEGKVRIGVEGDKASTDSLRVLITKLLSAPVYTSDLSESYQGELNAISGWTKNYGISPPLGYPRPIFNLMNSPLMSASGLSHVTITPDHPWCVALAHALFSFDRSRFNENSIPAAGESIGHHKTNDKLIGDLGRFRKQLRSVVGTLAMYLMQGPILLMHVHKRWDDLQKQYALKHNSQMKELIMAEEEARQELLRTPLHPLLTFIASAFSTGTAWTYDGKREMYYREGFPSGTDERLVEGQVVDAHAYKMGHNLSSDYMTTLSHSYNKTQTWGHWKKVKDSRGNEISAIDYLSLHQAVSSFTPSAAWDGSRANLGWTTLSAGPIHCDQAGGSFVYTDGDGISADPAAAMMGLVPVISLGNPLSLGLSRRVSDTFNTKASIQVGSGNQGKLDVRLRMSVLTIGGYTGSRRGIEYYDAKYMVTSMWMGESDCLPMNTDQVGNDPFAQRLYESFTDPAVRHVYGYLKKEWAPPTTLPSSSVVYGTDWDPWADTLDSPTRDPNMLGDSWVSGLNGQIVRFKTAPTTGAPTTPGAPGTSLTVARLTMYRRSSGFRTRFIVMTISHPQYYMYDEEGAYYGTYQQDGWVNWGWSDSEGSDSLDVSKSLASIDAIADVAVVRTTSALTGNRSPEVGGGDAPREGGA